MPIDGESINELAVGVIVPRQRVLRRARLGSRACGRCYRRGCSFKNPELVLPARLRSRAGGFAPAVHLHPRL